MPKKKEFTFTEIRTEVKALFDSNDESFYIKNSRKPWEAWKVDYLRFRECMENRLKTSMIRYQAEINELIDEYMDNDPEEPIPMKCSNDGVKSSEKPVLEEDIHSSRFRDKGSKKMSSKPVQNEAVKSSPKAVLEDDNVSHSSRSTYKCSKKGSKDVESDEVISIDSNDNSVEGDFESDDGSNKKSEYESSSDEENVDVTNSKERKEKKPIFDQSKSSSPSPCSSRSLDQHSKVNTLSKKKSSTSALSRDEDKDGVFEKSKAKLKKSPVESSRSISPSSHENDGKKVKDAKSPKSKVVSSSDECDSELDRSKRKMKKPIEASKKISSSSPVVKSSSDKNLKKAKDSPVPNTPSSSNIKKGNSRASALFHDTKRITRGDLSSNYSDSDDDFKPKEKDKGKTKKPAVELTKKPAIESTKKAAVEITKKPLGEPSKKGTNSSKTLDKSKSSIKSEGKKEKVVKKVVQTSTPSKQNKRATKNSTSSDFEVPQSLSIDDVRDIIAENPSKATKRKSNTVEDAESTGPKKRGRKPAVKASSSKSLPSEGASGSKSSDNSKTGKSKGKAPAVQKFVSKEFVSSSDESEPKPENKREKGGNTLKKPVKRLINSKRNKSGDESDDDLRKTKREGNYKGTPLGGTVNHWSWVEHRKFYTLIRDSPDVLNEEYLNTSNHPNLLYIRSGKGNEEEIPRKNTAIIAKYRHRNTQEWYRKAVEYDEKLRNKIPQITDFEELDMQLEEERMMKEQYQLKCTKSEEQVQECENENSELRVTVKKLEDELYAEVKEKKRLEKELTDAIKRNKEVEKELSDVSKQLASVSKSGKLRDEVVSEAEKSAVDLDSNNNKSYDSSDEKSPKFDDNQRKDASIDDLLSPESSTTNKKKMYNKIFGSTLSSLSTSAETEGGRSVSVGHPGGSKVSLNEKKSVASKPENFKFRLDRHPHEKPKAKRIPLNESEMILKFNHGSMSKVTDCFVKISNVQKQKLGASYNIPKNGPVRRAPLNFSPHLGEFDFGKLLFGELCESVKKK